MTGEAKIADKLTDAFDKAMGHTFWNELPDEDLWEVHALLWAWQIDAQNELVRRRMALS